MLSVHQLYIYPIKSVGGFAIDNAVVTSRGLQYDRRFMLVDESDLFISQREIPGMALLRTAIEGEELIVWHKDNERDKLCLPLAPVPVKSNTIVSIWDDRCEAQYVSEAADRWFSEKLSFHCRLVYMQESSKRNVDPLYAIGHDITSFSDGYPILLIGQESLNDLNQRLTEPLPMNRFRPNIVMIGGQPFEEDMMKLFTINNIDFYGVKLCGRCVVTTTDQETGITAKEPLKTLSTYRLYNNKVLFGQNVICGGQGTIHSGDEIKMVRTQAAFT
jgi:uncharacterized protein